MQRIWQYGKRFVYSILLAALAVVTMAMPVFANPGASVTYAGGALSGGAITFGDFGGLTLNGTSQTTNATWSIANITDGRGNGNGWNLSLTLSQLKEYSGSAYVDNGKTLPTSSITVTISPTVSLVDLTGNPANTITPVSPGTTLDTGSPVKILSAAINGGMGTYSFSTMTVTLTDPANTYAKTYRTDATVSLNNAP